MSLISAHNLHKRYPDGTHALRGVSLSIDAGEYVAIVGPSGSGKSTLLHILGLLDTETKGTYCYAGKRTNELSLRETARLRNEAMGFVFQMFNLLARASVRENVMLPLAYSTVPRRKWLKRAEAVLDAVDLLDRTEHEPSMLSGGEKQRVAIARAVINDPEVVFADEPTGNLDSVSGALVVDMLESLNKKGKTLIVITHDMKLAGRAGRVLSMHDGELVKDEKK